MPQSPKPKTCADQIKALQQANDQQKTALDTQALHAYFQTIGKETSIGAASGAIGGGELGGIVGILTGGVGLPVGETVGPLAGGFLGGIAGMGKSAITGGIQYRNTTNNIKNNWQLNYNAIQNYSNIGCVGSSPDIRY